MPNITHNDFQHLGETGVIRSRSELVVGSELLTYFSVDLETQRSTRSTIRMDARHLAIISYGPQVLLVEKLTTYSRISVTTDAP
jgi:hypothetical protein